MTGPRSVDIDIRLVMGAAAIALVVSVDTKLCAKRIAELRFMRFHARGRFGTGVARRQSSLKFDFCSDFSVEIVCLRLSEASVKSWDAILLAASVGLARIQLRVCDNTRVSRDANFLKLP